ncbi:MAG: hypothetical protein MZV64_00205 [Ignavibacteriales bacterium]|nr:hypothetical protein [Ignavibacteriales bacterium]
MAGPARAPPSGLVKLGDRRGYEFLATALAARRRGDPRSCKGDPRLARCAADEKRDRERNWSASTGSRSRRLEAHPKRRKVFRYKMVYLPCRGADGR